MESGGFEFSEDVQALYSGSNLGLPYQGLDRCRLRYFGGTTNHWSGWCRPLEREDLAAAEPGGTGWPISYDELASWYGRAHQTCQLGAVDYDASALAGRLGLPLLDTGRLRTVVYQYSAPTRFGEVYRDELVEAADVNVLLHANVVEIGLQESADAVALLRCATLEGGSFEVQAEHYVLACGAVENARLLLHGFGERLPLVGKGFMEHPHFYNGARLLLEAGVDTAFYEGRHTVDSFDGETPDGRPAVVLGALALTPDRRDAEGLPAIACTMARISDPSGATGEVEASTVAAALMPTGQDDAALYKLTVRSAQSWMAESRVTLGTERDALGMPRVDLDWRVADADVAGVLRSLAVLGAELARVGRGRIWTPLDGNGSYSPRRIDGGCHHMGTTRMAGSAQQGVVDGDGRVYGVPNLYVAGSSVFPSVGFANPTLTIVALAHRLADHLGASS